MVCCQATRVVHASHRCKQGSAMHRRPGALVPRSQQGSFKVLVKYVRPCLTPLRLDLELLSETAARMTQMLPWEAVRKTSGSLLHEPEPWLPWMNDASKWTTGPSAKKSKGVTLATCSSFPCSMALIHELQNVARLVQETLLTVQCCRMTWKLTTKILVDFWDFQPLTCMTSVASCPPSFSLSSGSSIKSEPKSGNSIEILRIWCWSIMYWRFWTLSRWHHHLEGVKVVIAMVR